MADNVSDVTEHGHSFKEQPWILKAQVYLAIVALFMFILGFVSWLLPYEPFTFYGWKSIPSTVCPLQPIQTSYISKVQAGPYTVGGMTGNAVIYDGSGKVVDSWPVSIRNLDPHPKDVRPSDVIRQAPVKPGTYKLGLEDMAVPGRMLYIFPDHQEFNKISGKGFTVVSIHDGLCKEDVILKTATNEQEGGKK